MTRPHPVLRNKERLAHAPSLALQCAAVCARLRAAPAAPAPRRRQRPQPAKPYGEWRLSGRAMVVGRRSSARCEAALAAMKAGGSAVDAAIAAHAVLGLVEPQSSGLGGGGYMVVYDRKSNTTTVFDGRETAPATATADYFTVNGKNLGFVRGDPVGQVGRRAGRGRALQGGARQVRQAAVGQRISTPRSSSRMKASSSRRASPARSARASRTDRWARTRRRAPTSSRTARRWPSATAAPIRNTPPRCAPSRRTARPPSIRARSRRTSSTPSTPATSRAISR